MKRCLIFVWILLGALAIDAAPIVIRVDATSAPGRIFHSHLTIPAHPGPLRLWYPKWIPGEHGPTGPIVNLAGLKFTANGSALAWQRDPLEMYAFHIDVPAGASTVDVDLDYLAPTGGAIFSAGPTTSARVAVLSWNTVLLYPDAPTSDELQYEATLRIPAGWKYATGMETRSGSGSDEIRFEPVSLTSLVDSPVLMAAEMRKIEMPNAGPLRHTIDLASENGFAIEAPDDFAKSYGRMVNEARALFGAEHYRHYDWLLTLSDRVAHFGLEHHESSDDRVGEGDLKDENGRKGIAGLLAHEYVHSWNGKYRRPAGLAVPNYDKPMAGELLWVYEGLTQYLGNLLPYRSGLWTAEDYRENLASTVAAMTAQTGRTWRSLSDTAISAQILYGSPAGWRFYRRSVDFYPESVLLWLDADMTIRRLTGGKKSLDDFCRSFYGGSSGRAELKPYTFDDVVSALNSVVANDWRAFLTQRIRSLDKTPPMGGVEAAGWRLVYNETPNKVIERAEQGEKLQILASTVGLLLGENGGVIDVVPDSPAARGGIAPGDRIVAVDGRKYSREWMTSLLKASTSRDKPFEMIVENGDYYAVRNVDYRGGLRHPHLEKVAGTPDLLEVLGRPLVK